MKLAANDPRHGTENGYINLGCRCARCRVANSVRSRLGRERRSKLEAPVHGKYTTYCNWKCRCPVCTDAWRRYNKFLRDNRKKAPTYRARLHRAKGKAA